MPSMGGLRAGVPAQTTGELKWALRSTSPWALRRGGSPKLRSNPRAGLLPSLVCSASLGSEGLGGGGGGGGGGERRLSSPQEAHIAQVEHLALSCCLAGDREPQ